jgi:hypothetical protein
MSALENIGTANSAVELSNVKPQYASSMQGTSMNNDFILTFMQPRTGFADMEARTEVMTLQAVAELILSPLTLKDLHLVIGDLVAHHESQWGPIETSYTRSRAKAAQ